MRLVDADSLMEHVWRDRLDSRELIAAMIKNAPTIKEIPTKIPLETFERLFLKNGIVEVLRKIRQIIAEDQQHVERQAKSSYNDIDFGINIGLKMALNVVDKHIEDV